MKNNKGEENQRQNYSHYCDLHVQGGKMIKKKKVAIFIVGGCFKQKNQLLLRVRDR